MQLPLRSAVTSALLSALAAIGLLGVVHAQEPPVYPVLYGGTAYVDGQPAPEGARVTARVGDYQVSTLTERRGLYRNLLVAPPTKAYYLMPVTFHLEDLTAQEQDVFLATGGPTFKEVGYDLHFARTGHAIPTATVQPAPSPTPGSPPPTVQPTPTTPGHDSPSPSPALYAVVVAGAVLLVVGGLLLWRNVKKSQG
ncbi:MAG: hypothetical protein HY680_07500 [Chloroflexi bacterium]|nr:hypothetical protein [Chloroflexota bacterium]